MEKKKIVLIGAGGHARVVIDILLQRIQLGDNLEIIGILDDSYKNNEKKLLFGIPIIEKVDKVQDLKNCEYIIAIGSNKIRRIISEKYNLTYYTAIHPKAIISYEVKIEEGTVVMAGAIINTHTKIGKHCIINTGSIIEHDCRIEEFAHISPNVAIAGGVKIGEETWIGIGSNIIQGIEIGEKTMIGAGSIVVKNIGSNVKAYGNPCREIII